MTDLVSLLFIAMIPIDCKIDDLTRPKGLTLNHNYMSEMNKCNTGIPSFMHKLQQV